MRLLMKDMVEIWKPILGYEGLYEVSNFGNVRSLFRYKKELKHNISKSGYASVQLFKNKIGTRLLVHRLVATAFIRPPIKNEQVNHIDENKLNNNIENSFRMLINNPNVVDNLPTGATTKSSILENYYITTGYRFQRLTTNSNIYTRLQDNGTWSEWIEK